MSRKAASRNILQKYDDLYVGNEHFKDAVDTLVAASIAAGGQALFTDMTPGEIAMATGIGIGGAYLARPIGKRVGKYVGNQLEKHTPDGFGSRFNAPATLIPGTPGSPEVYKGIPILGQRARAGYEQNFKRPDGTDKSLAEGVPYMLGREYSDAAAQAVIGLATPMMFGKSVDEKKAEEIAKLEQALAELQGDVSSAITQ